MSENTPKINKIYDNSAQLISLYTKNAVNPITTSSAKTVQAYELFKKASKENKLTIYNLSNFIKFY